MIFETLKEPPIAGGSAQIFIFKKNFRFLVAIVKVLAVGHTVIIGHTASWWVVDDNFLPLHASEFLFHYTSCFWSLW